MEYFQKEIDESANLALSNKFELLLFRLGTYQFKGKSEVFVIYVFKLREIVPMPPIT
ncbi:chemotaxis protein CheV, partial [Pantoea allii]